MANALLNRKEVVVKNSFDHTISLYETVHQNIVDNDMAAMQEAYYEKVIQYNDTIIGAEKQLLLLEAPDSIPVAVIKMTLLGGIAGVVLACVWFCAMTLLRGTLQSSAQLERSLSAPFLGTVAQNSGLFSRISHALSSERIWTDKKEALHYLSESAKMRSSGSKLLLISSLDLAKHAHEVKDLKKALSKMDSEILCEGDFSHNPNALVALQKCDEVIIVESVDQTKVEESIKISTLAKEYEKSVIGFVLV